MGRGIKICIISILLVIVSAVTVSAADTDEKKEEATRQNVFGITSEFDELPGEAKYLGSKYYDNYSLDIEKPGFTELWEKALNGVSNILFGFITMLSGLVCTVVYHALNFNFAELLSGIIDGVQKAMLGGIFRPLFPLAFLGSSIVLIKKFAKRDTVGAAGQVITAIVICLISMLLITDSSKILTATTNITKQVCNQVMGSIMNSADELPEAGENVTQNNQSFAKTAAGVIWVDLVHTPWKSLNFGNYRPQEEDIEAILSAKPGTEKQEAIKALKEKTDCFDKQDGLTDIKRIGMLLLYVIPFLIKSALYLLVAVLLMGFQALIIFLMLLAVVVLIMALLPGKGIDLLARWAEELLNCHFSMVILTVLLCFIVWIDKILYEQVATLGWLVAVLLQTVICGVLVWKHQDVMNLLLGKTVNVKNMKNRYGHQGDQDDEPERRQTWGEDNTRKSYEGNNSTWNYAEEDMESEPERPRSQSVQSNSEIKGSGTIRDESDYEDYRNRPTMQEMYGMYEEKLDEENFNIESQKMSESSKYKSNSSEPSADEREETLKRPSYNDFAVKKADIDVEDSGEAAVKRPMSNASLSEADEENVTREQRAIRPGQRQEDPEELDNAVSGKAGVKDQESNQGAQTVKGVDEDNSYKEKIEKRPVSNMEATEEEE